MYSRLISFSTKNNILTEAQKGFREKKSTETTTQSFLESIQDATDRGLHVTGMSLDLTKAYNAIHHGTVIDELNLHGIHGKSNLWFKSYLAH
jgi:hypothetical protein